MLGRSFAQTVIVAQRTDAVSLDPHDVTDLPSATITSHVCEILFELTPEGDIVPSLATGTEMSADGLTWTITPCEDVVFHDGTPLTAVEVKASLDRFVDPDNAYTFRSLIDRVTQVAVVDDYTVRLTLSTPYGPLISNLSHSSTAIVQPYAADELGEDFGDSPVLTGPFMCDSWDRGSRIDLVRFDDYWGELPDVERVVFLNVPEDTTASRSWRAARLMWPFTCPRRT